VHGDRLLLSELKNLLENACSDRIHYRRYNIGNGGGEWRASVFRDAVQDKEADDRGKKVGRGFVTCSVHVFLVRKKSIASLVEEDVDLILALFLVEGIVEQLEPLYLRYVHIGVLVRTGPSFTHVEAHTIEDETMKDEGVSHYGPIL